MGKIITVRDLVKEYHIYDNPKARLKELLSLSKKKYYREFRALDGITLDVEAGESVGIIGRNGSGKSTLLKLICGITRPTSGSVETRGRISALLELGMGFNPEFTGRENVFLNGALMGIGREVIKERYQDIVDFADIGRFIDQPLKTYSSGMYVRLAFACAVNVDPEILVVDEALSVGDVFFQQKCFRRMAEFKEQGKTMLLVSHAMDVIQRNCDRAVFLDKGRTLGMGPSRDVINRYYETILTVNGHEEAPKDKDLREAAREEGGKRTAGEDRCSGKPNYNRNEFRYGSFRANVVDFAVLDEDGREASAVASGGRLRFRFEVLFNERVESPVYGFMVRTKEGMTVYGVNTLYEHIGVKPGDKGDRVVVEFSQNMHVAAGDYFLSAGVSEVGGEETLPLDRRYDMAYIKVMPTDGSFGLTNLLSSIRMQDGGLGDGKG